MKRIGTIIASIGLIGTIGGCTHYGQNQVQTADELAPGNIPVSTPEHWQTLLPAVEKAAHKHWLQDFADPKLNVLVAKAVEQNLDFQFAQLALQRALANKLSSGAARWPSASLNVEASRAKRVSPQTSINNSYGLNAGLSWEIDLWQRLSQLDEAANFALWASEQDIYAARLSLAANVTKAWFAVIEARQQIELAQQSSDSYQNTLDTIENRYLNGLNSALDVRLARANLAGSKNSIALRQQQSDSLIRSLKSLVGAYPDNLIETPETLPRLQFTVPTGLPSELLLRRPDILAAEYRLHAAALRLESAKKNRLPSFKLTASGGTASDAFRRLLDWDELIWNILAGISAPIFDKGRLSAEQILASSEQHSAWLDYARSVQTAFQEVETTLAAEQYLADQESTLILATEEAEQAATIAADRYQNGLENITTLLDAQRREFSSRSTLLQAQYSRLENRIQLYLALGGAFSADYDQTQ